MTQKISLIGVVYVLGMALANCALCEEPKAEMHLSGIAGGMSYSTALGDNYQAYTQPRGAVAEVWIAEPHLLGPVFDLHATVNYLPYQVRGLTDSTLKQWSFLLGIETGRGANANWVKPFVSLDIGGVYSKLSIPAAVTSPTQNSSFLFAGQVRGGVDIPIWGKLSVQFASPLKVVFSAKKFVTLNGDVSLRWAL
ncbi:MAG TPA: hypothetical protein VJB59_05445 [Bdellovibrionota bacterium]|nr:hypothetical protein [Bdellovibrionota bacterium]